MDIIATLTVQVICCAVPLPSLAQATYRANQRHVATCRAGTRTDARDLVIVDDQFSAGEKLTGQGRLRARTRRRQSAWELVPRCLDRRACRLNFTINIVTSSTDLRILQPHYYIESFFCEAFSPLSALLRELLVGAPHRRLDPMRQHVDAAIAFARLNVYRPLECSGRTVPG